MDKEKIRIERTTPMGLRRDAEDFFEAYKLVYATHPDKSKWNANLKLLKVKYYLVSHALELYFKRKSNLVSFKEAFPYTRKE